MADTDGGFRLALREGQVISAHPLALTARRDLDERRQRALTKYYIAAGAGGIAVGVHTTQFAIRNHGMYRAVLELAAETAVEALRSERMRAATHGAPPGAAAAHPARRGPGEEVWRESLSSRPHGFVKVAGLLGDTVQAVSEAEVAVALGYDTGLLSLGGGDWHGASDAAILSHCRAVSEVIPLFGFYLQPAVGGRALSYAFWRELVENPSLVAIKIAPFDRYGTIDVVRAVVESGRDDIALYTGNDDSIVHDLITPFTFQSGGRIVERWIAGGLLGQWAVWTSRAVEMLERLKRERTLARIDREWLTLGAHITDANGAIFDAANGFAGCIAGIHEVLRRQRLMAGVWCLDPHERLSPGQSAEIDRVLRSYPELSDDAFVEEHIDDWMR